MFDLQTGTQLNKTYLAVERKKLKRVEEKACSSQNVVDGSNMIGSPL